MLRLPRNTPVAVVLLLFLATSALISAQDFFEGGQYPRLNLIDRTEGLPNNSVSSIQQDPRGFLWMGTQGGLTRYDGRNFHTYKNIPFDSTSLPHNLVQTTYYDETEDTLWVGTYSGLARYALNSTDFETFQSDPTDPDSLSDNVVIAISRGPDGALWVGTQNGLNRLNSDGTFTLIPTENEVIRALLLDSEGTLWIGTYGGLSRWNPQSQRVEELSRVWSSQYVMAIAEERPGVLLLGTWGSTVQEGGLVRYNVATGQVEEIHFADNRVYTVLAGSDGTIWAGTWGGGLYAITVEGRTFSFSADSEDGLASPVVYSLMEDKAGLIWIGTNGGGVHFVSPRQRNFRAFYHDPENPDSLPAGKINQIYRDRATGTLWVGLYSGGLARYIEAEDRWVQYDSDPDDPQALINDIVTVIYEDNENRLWIGTNAGLQMYDPRSDSFLLWGREIYPGVEYAGEIVYEVLEDLSGNFWIGTYHGGLTRVNFTTRETTVFKNDPEDPRSLSDNLVYDLFVDSRKDLWVATNGGLNRFDAKTGSFDVYRYNPENPRGLTSNTVRVLYEDSRDNFWVGTVSGGLNRLDRDTGTFTHLTELDGLSDNSIVSILEGNNGRIWLGTQRGLTAYEPASGLIEVLTERDGLFGSEFQNGHFAETGGLLLFGGSHGITRIDSSTALRNLHPPEVQIVDVRIFQDSVDPDRISFNDARIELDPDENFVSFEFVGLDYEASSSNRYAYQLVGFDDERIYAGVRNFATYTNLPAATYTLKVWSANADGIWSTAPASMTVTVTAPWFLRWWAAVIYAVAAVIVVIGALRWRTARMLAEKNADLEYANAQLARANVELERLSIRDSLTGLFNRRYFDSRLAEEWLRARRVENPVALLMIDIDHFKRFNDTYGHVVGDQVLSGVAKAIEDVVSRKTDFVARYGGEEFGIFLFDTPLEGAMGIAEKTRAAVAERPLSPGVERVTVSVGVCSLIPKGEHTPESLITCADKALYRAKENGRNRVEVGEITGS